MLDWRGYFLGTFQGYPPRSDYQPEGYQGYSNGYTSSSSSNFGKRGGGGGGGGPPRGALRGAAAGGLLAFLFLPLPFNESLVFVNVRQCSDHAFVPTQLGLQCVGVLLKSLFSHVFSLPDTC